LYIGPQGNLWTLLEESGRAAGFVNKSAQEMRGFAKMFLQTDLKWNIAQIYVCCPSIRANKLV